MSLKNGIALLLALVPLGSVAQTDDDAARYSHYVGLRGDVGKIMQTNDFLRSRDMKRYNGGQVEFGWQSLGTKEWEQAHNLPSFGVGVGTAWLDNHNEIGHPTSLFGFYKGTIARLGGHSIMYDIQAGLAWGWTCYDAKTNPDNIAIGSKATCRIGVGLDYAYTIRHRWKIGLGAGFTHYSNGAVRKPNKGINLGNAHLSLAYLLERRPLPSVRKPAYKLKGNEIDITLGYGLKRFEVDTVEHPEVHGQYKLGSKYNSLTLQCQFLHRYCHKGKYGIGLSTLYDELTGSDVRAKGDDVEVVLGSSSKRFWCGVFGAHEFCIGQLAIVTQMGYYFHEPKGIPWRQRKDASFQRAGLKYTLPIGMHAGVNIYAHRLTVADFIEWNIGYSLQFKGRKKTLQTAVE
ncbi:MAG: acyloxyacyl hydrolase [Marinilabiliaceae bacterium]